MLRLLLALVLLAGCGSNPPASAPSSSAPVASEAAPPDASVPSADAVFVDTFGCCSQGHWTCGRMPLDGEGCGFPGGGTGGCCQRNTWVCGRMPHPGECPGSGLPPASSP